MLWFSVRAALRTGYFVQLMVTSTISVLALQLLAAHASGISAGDAWMRAGLIGTWTTATVSAGIIGFQRFQGTLAHLALTPRRPMVVFAPLVVGPAALGLVSFPLAAVVSFALDVTPRMPGFLAGVAGIFLYWLACLSLACTIASLFVLTPNAITYEGLLVIPLVLLSGIFGLPENQLAVAASYALPTAGPVKYLLGVEGDALELLISAATTLAWFALAGLCMRSALRKARVTGTLEVL